MTRDDIVRMAEEAAIMPPNWGATENQWRTLHDFAVLVAAAERNIVMNEPLTKAQWQRFEDEIRSAEREACAQLCERMARRTEDIRRAALEMAADAIRARRQE